jgi:very-short-patch-repair endonuclease
MSAANPKQQWKQAERLAKREHLELTILQAIRAAELPEPEREYQFHDKRRWRFDFAYPDCMLAIEIEGGQWIHGRHNRGAGLERDAEKYNRAALMGWRVLRFTTSMVEDGRALNVIEEALLEGDDA